MLKLVGLLLLICLAELLLAQPSDKPCVLDDANDDCAPGECCLIPSMIATRREINREARGEYPEGYCVPLTPVGQSCNAYNSCGCASGTVCRQQKPYGPVSGFAAQQKFAAGNSICS